MTLNDYASMIPAELLPVNGSALFSGPASVSEQAEPILMLGANPGGDPRLPGHATIAESIQRMLDYPDNWNEWRDAAWGSAPGRQKNQLRVKHLFNRLGLDLGRIATSNVVLARSRRLHTLDHDLSFSELGDLTWPMHEALIENLGVRLVICLGGEAGSYVQGKLGAHRVIDEFVENNRRNWRSYVSEAPSGIRVATLTHPSIAKWDASATDPSELVARALN